MIKVGLWLIAAIFVFACATLIFIYNGFVLMNLWEWFIFPITKVKLSFVNSVGLACVSGFIRSKYTKEEAKTFKDVDWGRLKFSLYAPALFLICGYVIYQFM